MQWAWASLLLSVSRRVCAREFLCVCDPGRPAAPVRRVSTVVACLISTQGIGWHEACGIGGKKRVWGAIRICWHVQNTQRRIKRGGGRGGEVGVCWCGSGRLPVWHDITSFLTWKDENHLNSREKKKKKKGSEFWILMENKYRPDPKKIKTQRWVAAEYDFCYRTSYFKAIIGKYLTYVQLPSFYWLFSPPSTRLWFTSKKFFWVLILYSWHKRFELLFSNILQHVPPQQNFSLQALFMLAPPVAMYTIQPKFQGQTKEITECDRTTQTKTPGFPIGT